MLPDFHKISNLIKTQFPQFYLEEGPDFIDFLETYYQWYEDDGGLGTSRELLDNRNIDETKTRFLEFFRKKYMPELPAELLTDKRELQKHILDLYNSKGSFSGLRLLFRLLYNESIDIYIPSRDILKTSDGLWNEDQYIEVTSSPILSEFTEKLITGYNSGATAIVERVEKRKVNNKNINILFLSNIQGQFEVDELVSFEGADFFDCPLIKGTPVELEIINVASGYSIGDEIFEEGVDGQELTALATELITGRGIIRFNLIDGGDGYTLNADVAVTAGSNTTGSGATFIVDEIDVTNTIQYNTDIIEPYANVALNSSTFASSNTDGSLMASANLSTTIADALTYTTIEYGKIISIRTTNPGSNYDGTVNAIVTDPIISTLNEPDGSGGILGNNAVVTGDPEFGDILTSLKVNNSGFGYDDDIVTLLSANGTDIQANIVFGGIGTSRGFWRNNKGFLNADKYLQDSDFYQEFSYEIQSTKSLDRYFNILKNTIHQAGDKAFSKATITQLSDKIAEPIEFNISQTQV